MMKRPVRDCYISYYVFLFSEENIFFDCKKDILSLTFQNYEISYGCKEEKNIEKTPIVRP